MACCPLWPESGNGSLPAAAPHQKRAGNELADKAPGLLKRLEGAFGHRGLKRALAAMGAWELREEITRIGSDFCGSFLTFFG